MVLEGTRGCGRIEKPRGIPTTGKMFQIKVNIRQLYKTRFHETATFMTIRPYS